MDQIMDICQLARGEPSPLNLQSRGSLTRSLKVQICPEITPGRLGRAGIEPARPFGQGILSPQRLPFRHRPAPPFYSGLRSSLKLARARNSC